MDHRPWLALCMLPLLLAGAVTVTPHAHAHPFHLQIENDILSLSARLDETRWLAQSFTPSSDLLVSRVSLHVIDEGLSAVLQVSIRNDLLGAPDATNLTVGSADGPGVDVWLDVDLTPYVLLNAGQTYWIVARSTMPPGDGYEWWESGTEAAYPLGSGADSDDGVLWGPSGADFVFRVFGFQQPAFAFAVTPSVSSLRPGQAVVFRIDFDNQGLGSSAALWVNVSLPPELTYLADDAALVGGVRTAPSNYSFTDVAPGLHSFNLTASAEGGTPDGTLAGTNFTFDPKDHNGLPLTQEIQGVTTTIDNPIGSVITAIPWWSLAILLFALPGAAYLVIRRRRSAAVIIEEVFVVDSGGLLLAHRSSSIVQYKDEDLVVAMFTALQEYVRNVFSHGTEEKMRRLEFGERKILIESGQHHYVAVVHRGREQGELRERVRTVSREIDEQFGEVLAKWKGDMEKVEGIANVLPRVWGAKAGQKDSD